MRSRPKAKTTKVGMKKVSTGKRPNQTKPMGGGGGKCHDPRRD